MFHIDTCINISKNHNKITSKMLSNNIKDNITGKETATIDQIIGTKFNKNINNDKNKANSNQKANITKRLRKPTNKLSKNFILK